MAQLFALLSSDTAKTCYSFMCSSVGSCQDCHALLRCSLHMQGLLLLLYKAQHFLGACAVGETHQRL
jgi:hypothetical protein